MRLLSHLILYMVFLTHGNLTYAGGDSFSNGEGYALPASSCNQVVDGNPAGGAWALSIYEATLMTHALSTPDCILPPGYQPYNFPYAFHCVHDGPNRALTGYFFKSDKMSFSLCTQTCADKGFRIAGIEVGTECYCK